MRRYTTKPLTEMSAEELEGAIVVLGTPADTAVTDPFRDEGLWMETAKGDRFFITAETLREFTAEEITLLTTYRPPMDRRRKERLMTDIPVEEEPTPEDIEVDEQANEEAAIPVHLRQGGRVTGGENYINRVLDELIAYGAPMSNRMLASRLNLTPTQASGAGARLVNHGLAERMKAGVYKATEEASENRHRVDIGIDVHNPARGIEIPQGWRPLSERTPQEQGFFDVAGIELDEARSQLAQRALDRVERDIEEQAVELLDLICPNGVKAHNIHAANTWLEMTSRLIKENQ